MTPRDFDTRPYSPDEARVVEYLHDLIPDVGAGDDPIGFLIASHSTIVDERRDQMRRAAAYDETTPIENIIPPKCKEDVVDLLFRVQAGATSCRKAASLLFPQFELNGTHELLDALGSMIAAVDWEAVYIANESDDDEIKRRGHILLKCAREAKAIYTNHGGDTV